MVSYEEYKTSLLKRNISPLFDSYCKKWDFKCLKCGNEFSYKRYRMAKNVKCKCKISNEEQEVKSFISSLNIKYKANEKFYYTSKNYYELDIYIEELKLGIEYNGLYWHSNKYKTKNYHINKKDYFTSIGIDNIQIFSSDWKYNNDIIKSILLDRFGLNKSIENYTHINDSPIEFVKENSIEVFIPTYSLIYNNEIVGAFTLDETLKFCFKKFHNLKNFFNYIKDNFGDFIIKEDKRYFNFNLNTIETLKQEKHFIKGSKIVQDVSKRFIFDCGYNIKSSEFL